MDSFLGISPSTGEVNVASSYLDDYAHELWILHQQTEEGITICAWNALKML